MRARNFLDERGGGAPGMAVVPGRLLWNGGHMAPGEGHIEPGVADVFLEGVQGCVQAGDALVTGAEERGKRQESSAAITQPAAPW